MEPAAVACGFTPRSVRGVAAGAEPEVRIHLPPAESLSLSRIRLRRSRTRLSARVSAAGLATGSAETRRVFQFAPIGGNISVGPYSSTALPLNGADEGAR